MHGEDFCVLKIIYYTVICSYVYKVEMFNPFICCACIHRHRFCLYITIAHTENDNKSLGDSGTKELKLNKDEEKGTPIFLNHLA